MHPRDKHPASPPAGAGRGPQILALAALALLALVAYWNAFHAGFVFDDNASIKDNAAIRGIGAFFSSPSGWLRRPARFVGYLTFALNYRFGGLDPLGYHVANVCIHVANAWLVYALVLLAFRAPRLRSSALAPSSGAVAFAAAALFVAHPLQTQAVTYVVQRITSLATAFYLLAIVLYVAWRLRDEVGAVAGGRLASVLRYLAVLAAILLAMHTKEIAFTLPFAMALFELVLFGRPDRRRLVWLLPILATAAVIPLTMAGLGIVNFGGGHASAAVLGDLGTATRVQTTMSRWHYLSTQIPVVAAYLRLLVWPAGQSLDHDVPAVASLLEPRVVGGLVSTAALLAAAAFLLLRRALDPTARLAGAGLLWFFLAISVESSVIPIVDVMMEHRVYLPSAGMAIAAATGLGWLVSRAGPARPRRIALAAGAIALALAIAAQARNRVWANDLTLWGDAVEKSPRLVRPHNNLAVALAAAGRTEEAEAELLTDIRLDPEYPDAYYNLGRIRVTEGRYAEGEALLRRAIALRNDYADAYANLAAALNRLGRCGETVRLLEDAGAVVRDHPEAQFNLGVAQVMLGDGHAAERQLAVLERLSPALEEQLRDFLRARQAAP